MQPTASQQLEIARAKNMKDRYNEDGTEKESGMTKPLISDERYWDFRKKVENLVFDPLRRGGRTEDEILSELENITRGYAEMLKPQPNKLTPEELAVVRKVLMSTQVQNEIGAENWSLTETEEMTLWDVIHKLAWLS